MNNQKKKTPTNLKPKKVKSEEQMPQFGSLMNQIIQLKKELKEIKSPAKEQNIDSNIIQANIDTKNLQSTLDNDKTVMNVRSASPTPPSDLNLYPSIDASRSTRLQLDSIYYSSKQKKLKLDIEINKLRKNIVYDDDSMAVAAQINTIFKLINKYNDKIIRQNADLKDQVKEMQEKYQDAKEYKHKYKSAVKQNKLLESQLAELQQKVDEITKVQNPHQINQQLDSLSNQLDQALQRNHRLTVLVEQLDTKLKQNQEKCLTYEKAIERKEEELIMIKEDINYLRVESEKFKIQKKEIEKLYQKVVLENKELKRNYQSDIDQLEREKNKWVNECCLRREQSEEIQSIQMQKNMLLKEIQEMRSAYSIKCNELAENKAIMHEGQKKIIMAESEIYKLKGQNQKLERNNEFCKFELAKMSEEVEQIRKTKAFIVHDNQKQSKHKAALEQKQQKQVKLKALDDIHSLIRKHKQQIDNLQ